MTAHARDVLEFGRVLAAVGGRAASPAGRAAVEALLPFADVDDARRELAAVSAAQHLLSDRSGWTVPSPPEVDDAFERLSMEGGLLTGEQLVRVGRLLAETVVLHGALAGRDDLDPPLVLLLDRLHPHPGLADEVERTVDEDGEVRDDASKELSRLRRSLIGARARVVKKLEAYARSLPERFVVSDASVSVREGRYVIPIRREGRGEVGGIVHDESGTGATIFVEPPVAVEWMNEVRELERAEVREVQRILRAISAKLHAVREDLVDALEVLVRFDSLVARARAANEWTAVAPELRDDGDLRAKIVTGRHPLLLLGDTPVVPFDLELDEGEHTVVVSGPNTGGKSVFLKSLGLITLLARAGVVPPVAKGTVLPGVREVYADIGDEQSIAESLSTFSAHLATLRTILQSADATSMVLIDEMGTGTDPMEGAALARAILETLTARGALTVVTSHLGSLKTLDGEGTGVVNASLEFDARRMEPTYRFVKGRPGRSYGLAIARRLGFPDDVLDLAESYVDDGTASVEDLLERLEKREREARELVGRLDVQTAQVERLETRLKEQQKDLDQRERTAEKRAREEARKLLLDAREEVEAAIRQVRSAADEEKLAEAAREARRKVEEAAARRKTSADAPDPEPDFDVEVGMRVKVGRAGSKGVVVAVEGRRATVEVSGLKFDLPAADLTPIDDGGAGATRGGRGSGSGGSAPGESGASTAQRGWSGAMPDAKYEIDLRGLRVDEVDLELQRALDGAILSGLAEVRVIHGKGTGAVKSRVRELLDSDPRVSDFRNGAPSEGGGGVTMVVFR